MPKSRVAILRTKPATVLEDYHRLMNLAGYQEHVDKTADTGLKVNISWHFFFPGSSTVPWQLDGVIRAMKKDGYDPKLIHACHNRTVVIDAHLGERENMDGTFAGDGPGPRCMVPYTKNVILASADQVAIDAVAAKLMGFDPMKDCKFVRLAHEQGLGCGDVRDIEIVGDEDAAAENWHFDGPFKEMTFASRNQHRIYWGPLKKPVEWSLKTWLAPWAYVASVAYHDMFWYPRYAKEKMQPVLESLWGKLFANWGKVASDENGFQDVGEANPELVRLGMKHFMEGARLVGMAVAESPELKARKRRKESEAHAR
jgi:hypothetical protein